MLFIYIHDIFNFLSINFNAAKEEQHFGNLNSFLGNLTFNLMQKRLNF